MPLLLTADANPGTASWSTETVTHAIVASGTATILAGAQAPAAPIAVGAAFDGLPVLTSFQGATADATLFAVASSWDGSGNLTFDGNANATANVTVAYAVIAAL